MPHPRDSRPAFPGHRDRDPAENFAPSRRYGASYDSRYWERPSHDGHRRHYETSDYSEKDPMHRHWGREESDYYRASSVFNRDGPPPERSGPSHLQQHSPDGDHLDYAGSRRQQQEHRDHVPQHWNDIFSAHRAQASAEHRLSRGIRGDHDAKSKVLQTQDFIAPRQSSPPPPGPPPRPPSEVKMSDARQAKAAGTLPIRRDEESSALKFAPSSSGDERGRPAQIKIHSAFGEEDSDTEDQQIASSSTANLSSAPSSLSREKASATVEPDLGVGKDHRKIAALVSNKKFTSQISRWNSKAEEVQAIVEEKERRQRAAKSSKMADPHGSDSITATTDAVGTEKGVDDEKGVDEDEEEVALDFDFLDTEKRLACLLCQRQFKEKEILLRHAKESDLHKRNLEDALTRRQGKARKEGKADTSPSTTMQRAGFAPIATSDSEKYRDRASERRAVFGKEEVPDNKAKAAAAGGKDKEKSKAASSQSQESETASAPVLDESNKGGALLAKMGWSKGMGLGKESLGAVNPVEALVYRQGAGLGSSKGKSAEEEGRKRSREGKDAYVDEARERSRQRLLEEK